MEVADQEGQAAESVAVGAPARGAREMVVALEWVMVPERAELEVGVVAGQELEAQVREPGARGAENLHQENG